jgi:hypothetical protein
MKRLVRRLGWVGVALAVVALAFGGTARLLGPEPPGVTEANVERIREGMTVDEVEAILGNWPDDHTLSRHGRLRVEHCTLYFCGSGGRAAVEFDGAAKVVAIRFLRHPETTDGLLHRLRSLLGW